jgi:protein-tyrosine phosphatase
MASARWRVSVPGLSLIEKVPFQRSYWVAAAKLLAGVYPGAPTADEAMLKLDALYDVGIRHVVSLMAESETNWQGEPFRPYEQEFAARGITCVRLPLADGGVPAVDEMTRVLNAIDEALTEGTRTYVHCWGGKGRTGTVVGCWLVRHRVAPTDEAVALIQVLQADCDGTLSPSPETTAQRNFVGEWLPGQ